MTPSNIDLTAKKLAEQRKRNAAWKSMNESAGTVKASDKATKYRLPTEEEWEASKKQQSQKKELSPREKVNADIAKYTATEKAKGRNIKYTPEQVEAKVKIEEERQKNAPRKVTVERYIPTEEETPDKKPIGQLYNMTADGKVIAEPKKEIIPGFKHFVTDIIDSNEVYQMQDDIFGFEYGESISQKENLDTYEEVLSNPDIVSKLRDRAVTNFKRLHPDEELNPYKVDMMVNDVVKTRIAQEKKERQIDENLFIKQARAKNEYTPILTAGINQHIGEIDPMEKAIAGNIKIAKSLQKVLDDTTASYEKKNKAALELEKLGSTLESQLKKYDSDYSYMFDNKSGRRLSKAEVDNRIDTGESGTMSNREAEVKAMKALHKDQDLESLERGYFTHINKYNNYNKKLNKTYDINPSDIVLRNSLAAKGYKFKPGTNIFTGVKAKDIIPFLGGDSYNNTIEKAFVDAEAPGKGAQVRGNMVSYLKDLQKEKSKLEVEREAYKTSYLLNIDPKSLKQTFGGTIDRFAESAIDATIGEDNRRKLVGSSERKQLDEIEKVFTDVGIAPSKEQKEAFKRSTSMKVAEGVGSFVPELVKFAAVNAVTGGILGTTGYGARLAALGRSKNISDRALFLGLNALKEEATFKTVTMGESQTGGGAGFYLGGALANKLIPFRFAGSMARFNPIVEKVVLAGPGMVAGSEAAAMTEAMYKELRGSQSFKYSMEEMYGKDSEWADRMVVNLAVGSLIGTHHLKGTDFKSMSEKRAMFDKTYDEIAALQQENNPANAKKIEQKQNVLALLDREIQVADRNFISQDIGSLKKQMAETNAKIESGQLTERELSEAEDQIAKGEAHIAAVKRNIERDFKAASAKGAFGDGVSLNILDGKVDAEGNTKIAEGNKAEYDPTTNTINIDINQYKKGVLGHEAGHSMMRAAFKNNPEIAEKFKEAIKSKVESAFAGKKFNDGKTFEEAINEAYGENQPAEEYVMNVVEFLQNPKYRDVLLSNKFLPTLKRAVGELGGKIGLDLTSNKPLEIGEKNLNRASDLLEFLYDLGNAAEGKSSSALKNKFEKFKNIAIDGEKMINIETGKEIATEATELSNIEGFASKEINEAEKKDIFSKATKAYEETIKSGGSPEVAGLMVGMEMEPLVKKQVEGYLTSKGINMSRDQVEDIVSSITTDSGPGTFGIPNLVEAWSKGQRLIDYIKAERPSREMINSKAKELGIQDRTSAGSDSSTIDKYVKMAEGNTEQAQLTSYIFGNLPKRILQTLQKSEFADSFNTFSMEDVKNIDKLEESAGISGASSSSAEGYIDTSSPEQYTRVSQKKAETILQLPADLVEKINKDANKFLNSQKLENLDAKAIGTVPLKDGGKAKVAMLESDKARITYPDGRVETIKARSPKLVEQHLGAPDKSFEKQFNFKEGLAEDFKNSLFTDLSKHAGNIINNVKATPEYEAFIDNAFPLLKDYISQSAVNKRFAEFKEPFIDKATGKQAREKTAAGNPIFTKKNVTLAEWRKYFLGDGTQRIDGKRRSIIEALATELGFDATMNVLGKEAMRAQLESRQAELSVELVDNYVAVVAKQIDRNNPTAMASKIIEETAKELNLSKEEAVNELRGMLYDADGNLKPESERIKSSVGRLYQDMIEYFLNKEISKNTVSIKDGQQINTGLKTKLKERNVDIDPEILDNLKNIRQLNEGEIKDYNQFVSDFVSVLPKEILELTKSKDGDVLFSVISEVFGYTGRKSFKVKDETNKDLMHFGRLNFENVYNNITPAKDIKGLSEGLQNRWNEWVNKTKKNTPEGKLLTVVNKSAQFFKEVEKIQKLDISREDKITKILETPGLEGAMKDIELKSEFLELFLSTIGEKSKNLTKQELGKLGKNVAVILLNNDGVGIRKFSSENYVDLSLKPTETIKNEHLKAKATFAADVLEHLLNGTLNEQTAKVLSDSYVSLIGGRTGQRIADSKFGTTIEGFNYEKMALAQWVNMGSKGRTDAKQALSNVLNVKTGKTAWEELVDKKIVSDLPTTMASKNLAEDLSKMIERKKGIPAGEEISAAKAAILGRKKGNFEFFVPANAEDFAGMLYKFYGKGEQGNADMKLMKEALLDPYERGENALSHYRQKLATDMKAMDEHLNEIGGEVTKESKEALEKTGFDSDQATRVYIWNKKGEKIPDITDNEITELSNIVSNDARLRAYADGVMGLVDFPAPTDSWYASNIKYDLYKYSTEGVRKNFLSEWKENMDAMFTKENYNRMEAAYGKSFVDNFQALTKRMETGKFRPENMNRIAQKGLDWINGSVGVIMWMNMRSALLQTTSATNYINWSDNNILAAGKTFAKPAEFARTFKELINSDFLKQRRNGLEINIEDAEIARAIEKGGNAPQRLFSKLIKAGFKPTQIADSFSIAVGGTPFYINRTKTYQKEVIIDSNGNEVRKYTDQQAKDKAFDDFRALSEEHQQSSRQDRVSNVQLGVMGRLIFAFNNTSMQMARLQKKATLDIINKRGDMKTNVSKLVYYGVVQSAIFTAMQQGLFGLMFGKDEDELKEGEAEHIAEKKKEKLVGAANGMIDNFLAGTGMPGKLAVTAKNTLLKYQEEKAKGYKANYTKVTNEALSLSPPFSSKTKKVARAFEEFRRLDTKKGQKEVEGTGVLNSPYNMPRAQMVSAATNIPIDRVLTKLDNVITAIDDEDIQGWQRAALSLGWDKYSLGMYEDEYLDPTEQAAADAKEKKEKSAEAKATRDAKKAEEKAKYDALPQVTKDSLDLIKIKEKEKKSRDKYIKEQVRKSKLTPEQLEYEKYLAKEKRKKSKEKAKITKIRNQKIKDSINFANTRR